MSWKVLIIIVINNGLPSFAVLMTITTGNLARTISETSNERRPQAVPERT